MERDYTIYLNGCFFDILWDEYHYNDRPEPHREHEKSLWTIYQLAKLGHEIVIIDRDKQVVLKADTKRQLMSWLKLRYPKFIKQLDEPVYTSHPHPSDLLKV